LLRPEALQIFQKGQQNWADFKTKIDNVFVATVTIPAAPGNHNSYWLTNLLILSQQQRRHRQLRRCPPPVDIILTNTPIIHHIHTAATDLCIPILLPG
jgi:hypothetical protein